MEPSRTPRREKEIVARACGPSSEARLSKTGLGCSICLSGEERADIGCEDDDAAAFIRCRSRELEDEEVANELVFVEEFGLPNTMRSFYIFACCYRVDPLS
jgi:hypothetical protein